MKVRFLCFQLIIAICLMLNTANGQKLEIDTLELENRNLSINKNIKIFSINDSMLSASNDSAIQFVESYNSFNTIIKDSFIIHFESGYYVVKQFKSDIEPIYFPYPINGLVIHNVDISGNKISILDSYNNFVYLMSLEEDGKIIVRDSIDIKSGSDWAILSNDANKIIVSYKDGQIEMVNLKTSNRKLVNCANGKEIDYIRSISISNDESKLAVLYSNGLLYLIDLAKDEIIYQDNAVFSYSIDMYFDYNAENLFYSGSGSIIQYSIKDNDVTIFPNPFIEEDASLDSSTINSSIESFNVFSNDSVKLKFYYLIDDLDIMNDSIYFASTQSNHRYIYSSPLNSIKSLSKSKKLSSIKFFNIPKDIGQIDRLICNESFRYIHIISSHIRDITIDSKYRFVTLFDPATFHKSETVLSKSGNYLFNVSGNTLFETSTDTFNGVLLNFNPINSSILDKYFFSKEGRRTSSYTIRTNKQFTSSCLSKNDKFAYVALSDMLIIFNLKKGVVEDSIVLDKPISHLKSVPLNNLYLVVTKDNEISFVNKSQFKSLDVEFHKLSEQVLDIQFSKAYELIAIRYQNNIKVYDYNFNEVYSVNIENKFEYVRFVFYKDMIVVFSSNIIKDKTNYTVKENIYDYYYDINKDEFYLINGENKMIKLKKSEIIKD